MKGKILLLTGTICLLSPLVDVAGLAQSRRLNSPKSVSTSITKSITLSGAEKS